MPTYLKTKAILIEWVLRTQVLGHLDGKQTETGMFGYIGRQTRHQLIWPKLEKKLFNTCTQTQMDKIDVFSPFVVSNK